MTTSQNDRNEFYVDPGLCAKWSAPTEVVHQLGQYYPVSGGSEMAGKRDKPEDVVLKLRRVEVLQGQGMGIAEAMRQIGVTQRKVPIGLPDEERPTDDIIALTEEFGRDGYRMITGMLNNSGWHVNHKRLERIWRREGLKVPQKQPKKGRLWLNDGSCVRLRPERPNHVCSYGFVQDRTHDGRIFRTLNIIDEFTKEAFAIRVKRKLNSVDVVDALTDLFIMRGLPEYISSDNGAEFIAKKVREWIGAVGAKTAFIAPGSPWENGYCARPRS
jgi:putative transposase